MAPPTHFHVYSLPTELLDSLVPRIIGNQPTASDAQEPDLAPIAEETPEQRTRACNVCPGAAFTDVNDQRAHYRADWHRYNVKLRLQGGTPVSEADFGKLVDGLEDSLSGSASSDTHSSDSDSDAVRDLLQKTKISRERARSDDEDDAPRTQQSPLAWFHTPGPPPTQLGVYRVLFPPDAAPPSYLDELKALQAPLERKWAMFMTAGGHFAGAIVRVSNGEDEPEEDNEDTGKRKKNKQKRVKPETEMLLHKTFHRYTTRRKQGGSQGVNDQAGKKAISAGAMLRRYGEQALRDDIRGLLTEWADEIAECERVFIRASVSNRRIFLDYDGSVLSKTDSRLRTFPFPTRRPTQAELARCLLELTRVKISHLTEDALRAQDEAYLASLPKPKPTPSAPTPAPPLAKEKIKVPKLSPEEEAVRAKWARATDMIERGKLDALKGFWEKEGKGLGGADARVVSGDEKVNGRTLLGLAAREGQAEVVSWLLEEAGADPTVPVVTNAQSQTQAGEDAGAIVGKTRTAYYEASTKEVRDAFRRAAGKEPERWDWLGAGHVPSAFNQAKEDEKEAKQKARRKGLRDKLREREAAKTPEPEPAPTPTPKVGKVVDGGTGPRKLGGASGGEQGLAGLTPEMRLKVERERRARAVEARMKAMSGK